MGQYQFKKIKPLESNDAYWKVMHWFFSYPLKEVSLNDLIHHIKISKTTANKIVKRLAKEGFLKITILGKIWRISCVQQHEFNITRKIPYQLELIYESEIIEAVLKHTINPRVIVLFGSYRKGDDVESSDIDIAVETFENEEVSIFELGLLSQMGYRNNVKVNVLTFSRNKVDLNLFSNIVNGIVLYGFLEARP